jgi:hypothetical protein
MADKNNQQTEDQTPKWMSLDPDSPIYKAQKARAEKAAEREELTPREQELQWGREKFTEIYMALKGGKRRTLLGWIQNTSEITREEKVKMAEAIVSLGTFLHESIPSGDSSSKQVDVPLPV